jgi:FkbM family methyltransferase
MDCCTMPSPPRKIAFIIAATDHGTLIVNRFDHHSVATGGEYGVGFQLLDKASHDAPEVNMALSLLDLRRQYHGDGVVAVDCGANIGVHTVEWAKHMSGWGSVIALEAQERIFYALAGNMAINNCFNARAIHTAVASQPGKMKIPQPDYLTAASFGSLELKKTDKTEFIGQSIDYSESKMVEVQTVSLDSLAFGRVDLIKMDIEGMELEALAGATACITSRQPVLIIEAIKTDRNKLRSLLEGHGYTVFDSGINCVAVHKSDRSLRHIKVAA